MTAISIVSVDPGSNLLEEVILLGDANNATLGFLTPATFNQYAAKGGGVLAAIDESGNLAGYLLYRTPRTLNRASIVHFCVHPDYRGHAVSDLLFTALCERTKLLHGIFLKCRRDYENANRMWERLGFHAIREERGRGKQDTTITLWWYQHPHATLFDNVLEDDEHIAIVIGADIFFDFCDLDHASNESKALQADWLSQLEYVVTPELSNEINRQPQKNMRQNYQKKQQSFEKVDAPRPDYLEVEAALRAMYPDYLSDDDRSGLAHLAWTIAANVGFLVTSDDKLLKIAFDIYRQYQVRIFRPSDLILYIDELERVQEYQHMRLAGTNLNIRQIKAQEDAHIADIFQYADQEDRTAFLVQLRGYLSNPTTTPCYVVEDEGVPLVLFSYQRSDHDLRIPLFRVNLSAPQKRLVRYLLLRFVTTSANEGRKFTCITENKLHAVIEEALQEDTFQRTQDGWIKPNLLIAAPAAEVADTFEKALELHPDLSAYYKMHLQVLRQPENLTDSKMVIELERTLHPAKITNAEITSVLIPIEEPWISSWFDEGLAVGTLFGADKQRAFNREGVYYSKANRGNIPTPGRVLWYVSKRPGVAGTMCVRACARLDEIVTSSARELFHQYQHLGVIEWDQLLKLVSNDPDAQLTAYRFSDPQLFTRSVTLAELTKICSDETGNKPPIYSPTRIPARVFINVYKLGMELP